MQEMQETWVRSLGRKDPLGRGMSTHSGILAWKDPWIEEPGRLPSIGSQRVEHTLATKQQQLLKDIKGIRHSVRNINSF